jgi:hypothetical protein
MRTSKTFTVLLTALCCWIAFVVVAAPVTLVYLWLHPADFWQNLAFALALIVATLFPFKRRRKTGTSNPVNMKRELESLYSPRPASLTHREMTQAMRDTAERYGIATRRAN